MDAIYGNATKSPTRLLLRICAVPPRLLIGPPRRGGRIKTSVETPLPPCWKRLRPPWLIHVRSAWKFWFACHAQIVNVQPENSNRLAFAHRDLLPGKISRAPASVWRWAARDVLARKGVAAAWAQGDAPGSPGQPS